MTDYATAGTIETLQDEVSEDGEYTILKRKYIERGCRIAELEAETDNLKAIMLGEGGTKKVDLKQRYKGEAK